ncbi:GATA transcription factor 8-like [Cucurbita moschata]|uniref:GATA transcription factor 8-like n=1 Tax=Cucurbita moschata TaxID=3662 RepID=A0A6J1FLT4_CUCMO|nr:GATA transcription factor 8-like [Cucurbita moschata]XP_022939499.1 GATA transcription factor 8-like [Cucurbita moschata]
MEGSLGDEIDCGNCFDHIDDLLDFSTEDLDDVPMTTTAAAVFPPIWYTSAVDTGCSDSIVSIGFPNEIYEDIIPSEWFSNLDDSFAGAGTQTVSSSSSESNKFRVSSPVSVLDNSSESSSSKRKELADDACRRDDASSKRPRQSFFIPPPPHLVSPTSSSDSENSENSENYGESCSPPPAEKKIKLSSNDAFNPRSDSRKCLHCEVTKTPQWRAGPLGPKTLCNACGVRYKSGRLYPEYRPAASPSFVSRLHSNSHKKVIEMRIK